MKLTEGECVSLSKALLHASGQELITESVRARFELKSNRKAVRASLEYELTRIARVIELLNEADRVAGEKS